MRSSLGLAIALAVNAAAGWAVDWSALKPQGYVSDFANVIDVTSKGQLEAYCAKLQASTKVQLALVTVPTLRGEPVEDVARALARAWGVGQKGENDGILLLLAIGERKSRLEVGSGLAEIIPDSMAGEVLRAMRPALRQEHHGEAMMAAAETLGTAITQARNVPLEAPMPRKIRTSWFQSIPWPLVLGGLGLLAMLFFRGARGSRGFGGWNHDGILPALLLGQLMSRNTWGGRSSGGFDGPDSGDSFGGFGGGDFGGGGASSDW
jgi:uncharacterized protein